MWWHKRKKLVTLYNARYNEYGEIQITNAQNVLIGLYADTFDLNRYLRDNPQVRLVWGYPPSAEKISYWHAKR